MEIVPLPSLAFPPHTALAGLFQTNTGRCGALPPPQEPFLQFGWPGKKSIDRWLPTAPPERDERSNTAG